MRLMSDGKVREGGGEVGFIAYANIWDVIMGRSYALVQLPGC